MARTCAAAPWSSSLPRPRATDAADATATDMATDVVAADSAATDPGARDRSTATSAASADTLRATAAPVEAQAVARTVTGAETATVAGTVIAAVSAIVAVTVAEATDETGTVTVKDVTRVARPTRADPNRHARDRRATTVTETVNRTAIEARTTIRHKRQTPLRTAVTSF